MKNCTNCNRTLKSKGLIYSMYKIYRVCQCGEDPNPNYLIELPKIKTLNL